MAQHTATNADFTVNPILAPMENMQHEQVVFCNDNATGLKAIIAIHNTTLGPALGGTRMWTYSNELEALNDVLRLSRGMTYKAAISGLNLGGGKAVIIGDSRTQKNEALMRRFGKFVNSLAGKYITAEDVGMTTKDMEYINMETNHVVGIPESFGGGGDPSPVTAYGVFVGMKASAKKVYGNDSLAGKKVMVQGTGNVGKYLVKYLTEEGAKVYVTDIFEDKLKAVAQEFNAEIVDANNFMDLDFDIYAPCALGATINDEALAKLKCTIVCGAANNQLANEQIHGEAIKNAGILYAPDYLINAGGLINCYSEVQGYNRERAMLQTENIYNTLLSVFNMAVEQNIPTYLAANQYAEQRINSIGTIKLGY